MNRRIRALIITAVTALLAFSMMVSCDGNVITTKNKDVAYTEILETNGSFVYNGQNYDSLSDAIKAIAESGEPGTVEVTGTSYIRPVTIPEGADVTIDLKEHELKFFDVKDSAVKALAGANLSVSNGTLSLTSTDKSLSVLSAEGTDSKAILHAGVTVNGPVSVSDGAKLYASNYLEDVRVYGPAGLIVEGEGVSYVTVNDTTGGETSYGTSPNGTIVDMTGTIDHVDKGFWAISRGTHTYFYGSLKEAVDSLEADDTEIKLIGDDNDSQKEFMAVVLDKSIKIVFGDDYVASKYSIELTNGADLTTKGIGRFVGDITAAEGSESDLSVTSSYIIGDVTLSGDLTVSAGKIEGDVTVATVTGSDLSYFQGNVTASGDISLTDSRLVSTTLVASTLNSTGGKISLTKTTGAVSDITATVGEITIANSEVPSTGEPLTAGTISAVSLDATGNADKHVVIGGNVSVTGAIDLTYVEFNSGTETAPSVTSANGDINLTNASGTAGAITADGEDGSGNVSIDNSNATITNPFKTGDVSAKDKVDIKGKEGNLAVDIRGNVYADEISIKNSHIIANAVANGKTGDEYTPASSVTIDNPKNTSDPYFSRIGNLYADKLSVSATSAGTTLEVGTAVVSGDENTESTVNGGFYGRFTYDGEGSLSVIDGYFIGSGLSYDGGFTHSGTGSVSITGGTFAGFVKEENSGTCTVSGDSSISVVGDSEHNNLETVNELISLVNNESTDPVTIVYRPSSLIEVADSITVASTTSGKAELRLYAYETTDSKATQGIVVVGDCELTFGENVTLNDSDNSKIYIAKGNTLISNISLDGSANKHVYKINADNNAVGKAIVADTETIPGKYVYNNPMNYTVTFNANGGTASETSRTVNPGDPYGTLPTATKTGYEISGWYTEIESGTEVTETMVPTDDITLYAHWEQLVLKPATVDPHKAIVSNSKLYNADGTVLSEALTGIVPGPNQTNYKYYYVNTSDTACVVYGKYNYNYHYIEIRNYYSSEYHYANLESGLGLIVIQALADANGKTELYFNKSATDTGTKVKYYKDGSEWKFEVGASPSGTIYCVHFDGTGQHFKDN